MFSQKNKAEDSKTKNKLMFYWKNSQSTHQKGAHTKKTKKKKTTKTPLKTHEQKEKENLTKTNNRTSVSNNKFQIAT